MSPIHLKDFVCARFAREAGIPWADIVATDLTLAQIITRSEKMNNSLDLMEAFARIANALKKEHGVRVRLPTFPLDTPASEVIDALVEQLPASASPEVGA